MSPDTDATVCAILWAWYLNTHTSHKAEPFVLGSLNKETQFVLSRWNTPEPALLETLNADDTVVIVDTNNPEELPANLSDAKIMQIIDHHRLVGGIKTDYPFDITVRTLASTASIMHDLMGAHAETMPNDIAGLMLSCILSDTLAFRSPTTTPHDKNIAEKIAQKLGLDINAYADEMFAAKSDISDYTDTGLVHMDSKKFALGDKNVKISVVETTAPQLVMDRKEGIIAAIESLKSEEKIDDVLFFIVDILKEEATVLTYNQFTKDVVSASFGVTVESDTEVLPGIVSRKKQIIPSLKLPN